MPTTRLTTSESLMLDIIRVVAAAVVAFGHLTQPHFSTGWTDRTYLARCAVSVFFVLSGFVIRYVTVRRPTTLGHYLGDRASRIYSVAIPALALTLITDTIARHANPGFYSTWAMDSTHPLLRVLVNLIFCGQLWTYPVAPLSNSPFWSVEYEVVYYLVYGCFFYLEGVSKWFWIAAILLIAGPRVIYLAPLWIAGCVLHDLYQRWNAQGTAAGWINSLMILPVGGLLILVLEGPRHPGLAQISVLEAWPHLNAMANNVWVHPPDYVFGIFWSVIFLWLLLVARQFPIREESALLRPIRFIAEGTFPIYLTHFPLLVLIAACVPYNHASPVQKLILFAGVVLFGILAGHPANLFKDRIRQFIFSHTRHKHSLPHVAV